MAFKLKKRPNPLQSLLIGLAQGAAQGFATGARYSLINMLRQQETDKEIQFKTEKTTGEMIKFLHDYGEDATRIHYAGNPVLERVLGVRIGGEKGRKIEEALRTREAEIEEARPKTQFEKDRLASQEEAERLGEEHREVEQARRLLAIKPTAEPETRTGASPIVEKIEGKWVMTWEGDPQKLSEVERENIRHGLSEISRMEESLTSVLRRTPEQMEEMKTRISNWKRVLKERYGDKVFFPDEEQPDPLGIR